MSKIHLFFAACFAMVFINKINAQGLFPVDVNGKWGYIDSTGRMVIEPKFTNAGAFSDSMALVINDGKICYINTSGAIAIATTYEAANPFYEGMAAVMIEQRWGFINKKGEPVIEPQYYQVSKFSDGLCRIKQTPTMIDQWGFVNTKGQWVIDAKLEKAGDFSEGLALIGDENGMYGYIDLSGKIVIPKKFSYNSIKKINGLETLPEGEFGDGLAAVTFGKKHGYINEQGKLMIDTAFDYAGQFSEGLAAVSEGGEFGYIDKTGKTVIPFIYDGAEMFAEGIATVKEMNGKYKLINKKGEAITESNFYGKIAGVPFVFRNGALLVAFDKKIWGYIDKAGKTIWKYEP